MRIARFNNNRLGVVEGSQIYDVSEALELLPEARYPFPTHDILIENLPKIQLELAKLRPKATSLPVADVTFLSPVANPSKIVAAPVNYRKHLDEAIADEKTFSRAHVREIHETGLFLKATSALIGASSPVLIRHTDRRTDHEVELVAIIGRTCSRVAADEAMNYVAGYSVGLDISVRGPEERSFRKSVDTYAVLGPWLVTSDELDDPSGLQLSIDVNGEVRQSANTRDLILDVAHLIEFASSFYTLLPGDILFTGTPEGVGPIRPGDRMCAKIDRIGELNVPVEAASGKIVAAA